MSILASIGAALGGQIVDSLLGRITGLFEAYFKKQISEAELRTKVLEALLATFRDVEVAHAEALSKTYESFQQTLRGSPELIRMFKVVIYSQTFVLFWSQWVVPMLYMNGWAGNGWRPGTTAEWAYLLIGGLCGAAPMLLRSGPGAGSLGATLKGLVGK